VFLSKKQRSLRIHREWRFFSRPRLKQEIDQYAVRRQAAAGFAGSIGCDIVPFTPHRYFIAAPANMQIGIAQTVQYATFVYVV